MRHAIKRRVAVGFFDGVHLGHQAILKTADAAVTFKKHPLSVISPDLAPKLVMSLDERLEAIRRAGVGEITLIDFTHSIASCPCADFALGYFGKPGETIVLAGADWRFGRGGEGDTAWLEKNGYDVEIAPYEICDGERISSSRIRSALMTGDVASARRMLSRPYTLEGDVFKGKGRGAVLGFPTVNFAVAGTKEPIVPCGVYEALVSGAPAIVNFGFAPTFGADAWGERVIEAHFLENVPMIPPRGAKTEFLRFIRREEKFSSLEELKKHIAADKKACIENAFGKQGDRR